MKVLIAEDDRELQKLISVVFENAFVGSRLRIESSWKTAVEVLEQDPAYDLVVSDDWLDDGSGLNIYKYLQASGRKTPYVLTSAEIRPTYPELGEALVPQTLKKPYSAQSVLRAVQAVLGGGSGGLQDHCRIPLDLLVGLSEAPHDLFLRLSDTKFIKVVGKADPLGPEDVEKYARKHVNGLFVRKEDFLVFMERLIQGTTAPVTGTGIPVEGDSRDFELSRASLETVGEIYRKLGLKDDAKRIIDRTIDQSIHQIVRSSSRLEKLFERLLANQDNYLAAHSIALAGMTASLNYLLGEKSEATAYKMSLAAMLHDISLEPLTFMEYSLKLAAARSSDGLKPPDEAFYHHNLRSAQIASEVKEVPFEVENIILQHHERPDGSGFPHRVDWRKINPATALFILSHEFVDYVMANGMPGKMATFCNTLPESYGKGPFRPLLKALSTR